MDATQQAALELSNALADIIHAMASTGLHGTELMDGSEVWTNKYGKVVGRIRRAATPLGRPLSEFTVELRNDADDSWRATNRSDLVSARRRLWLYVRAGRV